ncbi:MAG: DUF488 family protein, N3 subclade, partial [Thermoplasmata archaeon]
MAKTRLADSEYQQLLALRTGLRRFLHWSEEQAQEVGLTPAQHQLLLAVRGYEGRDGPTIGDVADSLLLRHHSVVELVQRAEVAGLLERFRDADDRRVVRLALSTAGSAALEKLSSLHLEELRRLADDLRPVWDGIDTTSPRSRGRTGRRVKVARVYDPPEGGGTRLLVDRLWPRGVRKDEAPFDRWETEVAPSTLLRRWYGHRPERFGAFAQKYRAELRDTHGAEVDELRAMA